MGEQNRTRKYFFLMFQYKSLDNCLGVCVRERERERELQRGTEREREREREQ